VICANCSKEDSPMTPESLVDIGVPPEGRADDLLSRCRLRQLQRHRLQGPTRCTRSCRWPTRSAKPSSPAPPPPR
jgi:hypothetical protein